MLGKVDYHQVDPRSNALEEYQLVEHRRKCLRAKAASSYPYFSCC